MKNAFSIIVILLLAGCSTITPTEDVIQEVNEPSNEVITFDSIEEYIDAIEAEYPGENKFLFEESRAGYSIEGYELITDENGDPMSFENDQTAQYENAFFWIYAESGYESKTDSFASFYLRGIEGPRDAVYGPFEGKLAEMLR